MRERERADRHGGQLPRRMVKDRREGRKGAALQPVRGEREKGRSYMWLVFDFVILFGRAGMHRTLFVLTSSIDIEEETLH